MRVGGILTILFALVPAVAVAEETPKRGESAPPVARRWPNPADVVAPGVWRQDLFDRRNPANVRQDYPAPPAQRTVLNGQSASIPLGILANADF